MEGFAYVEDDNYKNNVHVLVLPGYQGIVDAAMSDRDDVFKDLLAHFEDINTVVDTRGNTLLNVMTILGRVHFFNLIIDREDANLVATDDQGNTALHFAARKGNIMGQPEGSG
ncbi:unnamed protein product [Microthlaspi erraticum]|uniref:Uncharacterized protein n=1 Tax=Microthlaspi erraticum TaxID=1685480 RepID=A0A6D2KQF5_9BRAS|nr:unnamed protein product [Microthlaspi erraticum]